MRREVQVQLTSPLSRRERLAATGVAAAAVPVGAEPSQRTRKPW